jgi:putative hydrolase of the HAD superfamily
MIKAIFFDLDGTLYKSTDIRKKFAEAAYYTLSKFRKIPLANAQRLVEERRDRLKKEQGFSIPYTLTLKSFGVPIEYWHDENIAFFDPRDYLAKDEELRKSLVLLKKHHKLAVLTNNNRVQAERTLIALNIINLFDGIFTYNSFKLLKPDPEFFKRAVAALDLEPEACCFVGDRYNVDLGPAKELGMHIYEVQGPADIYELGSGLDFLLKAT